MNARPLILAVAALFVMAAAAADEPSADQKPAASAPAKAAAKPPAQCSGTGTRIRLKAPNCGSAAPLRSYSQQDLQSTGETDLGQALKKLDPIFR